MKKIELLAPVGSMESLYAAINNGADAVYLGGKMFNARQYASNFGEEELKEAIKYSHDRGVKVYVTLNISIKECELKELREYLQILNRVRPDALIVQDLGVINIVKNEFPELTMHGSTQMTITNSFGVNFLKEKGLERTVLARELTLSQIEYIKKNTDAELEVFVHGALCVSYSGQCLMSSVIGGRSGNRGRCAQTCRMPFTLTEDESGREIELGGNYIISPKDLNTVDNIGKLIDIGVDSFKIEGRMKKPEYVALIVNKYRKAIDSHLGKRQDKIDDEDREDIRKIFNRGFTKGFLGGDFGRDYISLDKPNNRGTYIGQAQETRRGKTKIKLDYELRKGDGLSADNPDGYEDYFNVDKIFVNRKEKERAKKNQIVEIMTYRPIREGAKLYKTFDKDLDEKIKENYIGEKDIIRKPADFEMKVRIGEIPLLKADSQGLSVTVTGESQVEKAKKAGIDEERIKDQLRKLNDTVFEFRSLKADLDEGAFMPVSVINSMRREAAEQLEMLIRDAEKNESELKSSDGEEIRETEMTKSEKTDFKYTGTGISVSAEKFSQIKRLDFSKLSRLYIPYGAELSDIIDYVKEKKEKYDFETYLSLPKIIDDGDISDILMTAENIKSDIDGVSVSNIGSLEMIKRNFSGIKIHADSSFNIYNEEAVKFLIDSGACGIGLSPELNMNEIKDITDDIEYRFEVIGYGYLKLMTMKNCPMALVKKCGPDRDCLNCSLKSGYSLKDRMDMDFSIVRNRNVTHILNSKILFVPEYIDRIKKSRIPLIKLEFNKDEEMIEEIQDLYWRIAENDEDINIDRFIMDNGLKSSITKGHYNRGVE